MLAPPPQVMLASRLDQMGWHNKNKQCIEEEKNKYVLTMACYVCERHHVLGMQAVWAYGVEVVVVG